MPHSWPPELRRGAGVRQRREAPRELLPVDGVAREQARGLGEPHAEAPSEVVVPQLEAGRQVLHAERVLDAVLEVGALAAVARRVEARPALRAHGPAPRAAARRLWHALEEAVARRQRALVLLGVRVDDARVHLERRRERVAAGRVRVGVVARRPRRLGALDERPQPKERVVDVAQRLGRLAHEPRRAGRRRGVAAAPPLEVRHGRRREQLAAALVARGVVAEHAERHEAVGARRVPVAEREPAAVEGRVGVGVRREHVQKVHDVGHERRLGPRQEAVDVAPLQPGPRRAQQLERARHRRAAPRGLERPVGALEPEAAVGRDPRSHGARRGLRVARVAGRQVCDRVAVAHRGVDLDERDVRAVRQPRGAREVGVARRRVGADAA